MFQVVSEYLDPGGRGSRAGSSCRVMWDLVHNHRWWCDVVGDEDERLLAQCFIHDS